jgi:hypothetical protein
VLQLADETVTYGELLLVGDSVGLLEPAVRRTVGSLRSVEGEGQPSRDDLRAEASDFRRKRRLQSGEDLRGWLGSRHLTTAQWESYLWRSLIGCSSLQPTEATMSADAVEAALVVDLACGGWWQRAADEAERHWAADCLMAAEAGAEFSEGSDAPDRGDAEATAKRLAALLPSLGTLDVEWCAARLEAQHLRHRALEAAERKYNSHNVVAGRIADRSADWVRLVFDELCLPTRAAANEAVLCSREDHMAPSEIARRAGRSLERRDLRRDQVPTGTAALLAGAVPDQPLGPLEKGDEMLVFWLHDRRMPSIDDPVVRDAAAAELLAEALDRAAAGRARPVGPL